MGVGALLLVASSTSSVASALISVSVTQGGTITDNDTVATGDAGSGTPSVIGVSSANISGLNDTAELGYRFTGYNSGRGVSSGSQTSRSITQTVDVWAEWTISAVAGVTYSFVIDPELAGRLNIVDGAFNESGDSASISNFSATLEQNSVQDMSADLLLNGGSRFNNGTTANVNSTKTEIFTGLTGNNTFRLQYNGTVSATWLNALVGNNRTANAALWGIDGTMDGGGFFLGGFDNYPDAAARDADGLFVKGTVELTAVPEPATYAALAGLLALGFVACRRRVRK